MNPSQTIIPYAIIFLIILFVGLYFLIYDKRLINKIKSKLVIKKETKDKISDIKKSSSNVFLDTINDFPVPHISLSALIAGFIVFVVGISIIPMMLKSFNEVLQNSTNSTNVTELTSTFSSLTPIAIVIGVIGVLMLGIIFVFNVIRDGGMREGGMV